LLQKELGIRTIGDLVAHYPFRYEDRTRFYKIAEIDESFPYIQVIGKLGIFSMAGAGPKKRLVSSFSDATGSIDLVWFQGIKWTMDRLKPGTEYVLFGKPARYGKSISVAHPELEPITDAGKKGNHLQPVYSVTEKLRARYLDSKFFFKLQQEVLRQGAGTFQENLPESILEKFKLLPKSEALRVIHFPKHTDELLRAQSRLKFEELFFIQLQLIKLKLIREQRSKGIVFKDAALLTEFYHNHLPFPLTNAQKKVIKEIYSDMKSGTQMNRLLQGDVGSGKTIVGFISMLVAIGGGTQAALMAPTEILAQQHYQGLRRFAEAMNISISLLTGSTKKSERKPIHGRLQDGSLKILVGTHALLEEEVRFNQLGLAVIDEQHRFGVAQRSRLWKKNDDVLPHVLVMTATPIPRTLAMTLYGDLDVSVIDELPKGRKPIRTEHRYDGHRLQVQAFLKAQISQGRQVYVVYPLIEESEKLDLKHLMDGYESISRAFPDAAISILHGKMDSEAKEFEMNRFKKGETSIMVATTVIEVGVDIPNATVMVIENAERFGLSQLHQLRGRVGRGGEQSYCILMTDVKLSAEARLRMETMVRTNNGFEVAETDLKLRGPGDLMGTQQSGLLDLKIADLGKDGEILKVARDAAVDLLKADPDLIKAENRMTLAHLRSMKNTRMNWSRIS
jgi:ATP-dependent DNA helicase RecG